MPLESKATQILPVRMRAGVRRQSPRRKSDCICTRLPGFKIARNLTSLDIIIHRVNVS